MTGRIGAWSANHARFVVAVWLVTIAAGLLGLVAAGHELTFAVTMLDDSESRRGGDQIRRHFDNPDHVSTQVLCATGPSGPVALALVTVGGSNVDGSDIAWCYEHKWGVAPNREPDSASPVFRIDMPEELGESEPAGILRQLLPSGLTAGNDEARSDNGGGERLRILLRQDLLRAEVIAVPLTLLILVGVVGSSVRALAPIVVGAGAIAIAAGIIVAMGTRWSLSIYSINMIAMLGLATSVDYTLLVLQREHDETRARAPARLAIAVATATAGRTVAVSGLTVIIALGAMLPMPISVVRDLALSAMIAVAVGVAATLSLLPALLAMLGPGASGRTPVRNPWQWWVEAIGRRPASVVATALIVLLTLASQATRLQTQLSPIGAAANSAPEASTTSAYWEQQATLTLRSLIEIVIDTRLVTGDGIDRLIEGIGRDSDFAPIVTMQASINGDMTVIRTLVVHTSTSAEAERALDRLQSGIVPSSLGPDWRAALVTGPLAQGTDVKRMFAAWEPRIMAMVLIASYLVLAIVFRSLVLPLVATLGSLLSVLGTLGVLVLVVQDGHGASLLGIPAGGPIETWVPVALFSIMFGLSIDYHLFLLSRITERYRQTGDVGDAVVTGVASTGRVIAAGALIMTVVFASFATGSLALLQQLGLGLAISVVIDAFVIRLTLVPAITILLGPRNWWTPTWLARPVERFAEWLSVS